MELTDLNADHSLVIPQLIDKDAREQQRESLKRNLNRIISIQDKLAEGGLSTEEENDLDKEVSDLLIERTEIAEGNYALTPRCLYYTGLQPGKWRFEGQELTTYPRSFSYDSGDDNAFNFAYGDFSLTDSKGLIDRHWIRTLDRINSPQLVGWFDLEEIDIEGLDFSKPKRVRLDDGNDYIMILDNIEDFKHGKRTPTRVELLQLKPL